MSEPVVILQARNDDIERLVHECAARRLSFNELCKRVDAMGFKTTSLYEMVRAVEDGERSPKKVTPK